MSTITVKFINSSDESDFVSVAVDAINANGAATTVRDVFAYDEVRHFLPDLEASDLEAYNGGDITSESILECILDRPCRDGDEYTVDCPIFRDEDEEDLDDDDPEENEVEGEVAVNQIPSGTAGTVEVITNGGFVRTTIQIHHKEPSVDEVVFNDAVIQRSGLTRTQLSSSDVSVNNVPVGADAFSHYKLSVGDEIRVSLRVSKSGGIR